MKANALTARLVNIAVVPDYQHGVEIVMLGISVLGRRRSLHLLTTSLELFVRSVSILDVNKFF